MNDKKDNQNNNILFGCHISVKKRILGGFNGYSFGNVRFALKKPPSLFLFIKCVNERKKN